MNKQRKSKRDRTDIADVESCLIGCYLLDPTKLNQARLTATDFFDQQLGKLFALLADRYDAGIPIDPVALREPSKAIFDNPAATLAELFSKVPSVHGAEYYAGLVREASKLRKLQSIADDINDGCTDTTQNSETIIVAVEHRLNGLHSDVTNTAITAFDAGMNLIDELATPKKRRPVFTGIESVDQIVGGILPGELEIIAARPGNGKTSLAMQIALQTAKQSRPVLFCSLEMTALELIGRVLCGMAGIDNRNLRRGQVDPRELHAANEELEGMPLEIWDPPAATMQKIRGVARMQSELDLLIVDYIGLIQPRDRKLPRYEQVTEITAELKQLAKELCIPVIALCQLNRQADGKEPLLSHLRESGSIEQDADVVLFLHRIKEQEDNFKLIVGKHRHGETGKIPIMFNPKATRFH